MSAPSPHGRASVSLVFFVNGAVFGVWAPQIPLVKERLCLDDAGLGLALLCLALGAFAAMTLTGRLIARFGARALTRLAGLVFCAALPLPVAAPGVAGLCLALALFGAANGTMDVAMNALAVAVEKRRGRPIMSSFHGCFSLGGLAGSALAGLALGLGAQPVPLALGAAVAALALAGPALVRLPRDDSEERGAGGKTFVMPPRALIGLCLLAFVTLVCEGAMADWTSVFLNQVLGTGPGLAAGGYAAFSLAMAAGRLCGDALTMRLGAPFMLRGGLILAGIGLVAAVAPGAPGAALAGFAGVGLGLSNAIPLLFSAAGRVPGVSPGAGIASAASVGYLGFLVGPPMIGLAAQGIGLGAALAALAAPLVVGGVVGRRGV